MRYCSLAVAFAATALFTAVPALARQEPSASPAPPTLAPVYMEVISLRYTDPAAIAQSLNASKLPEGTRLVKPDPKAKRSLRVVGTQDAIDAIKGIVSLLDAAPRKISMDIALERIRFDKNGKKTVKPLGHKIVNTVNNIGSDFSYTDDTKLLCVITVTPRLSRVAGTTDTVLVRMGLRKANGATVGLERVTALPGKKQTKRIIGLAFVEDKSTISTVGTGNYPTKWTETFTAYYVSAKVLPAATTKKP